MRFISRCKNRGRPTSKGTIYISGPKSPKGTIIRHDTIALLLLVLTQNLKGHPQRDPWKKTRWVRVWCVCTVVVVDAACKTTVRERCTAVHLQRSMCMLVQVVVTPLYVLVKRTHTSHHSLLNHLHHQCGYKHKTTHQDRIFNRPNRIK